ncbi:MAG: insulinase family protein [Clostridia bacterium]|nr:insulinase family protein [Clostridia bacterium]
MNIKEISGGVRLCIHKTAKFKNSVITLNLLTPLSEDATKYALLINLLARTNKSYSTIMSMNRRLASLYGATITPSVSKIGEVQVLSLSLLCLDDRFALGNDRVWEECVKLLCTCLFKPDITPEGFREENVQREKRLLAEAIESRKDEKRLYAFDRMTEEMCRDEIYGISPYGRAEDIEKITGKELMEIWKKLLFSCPVQINVTGNINEKKTEKIFSALFDSLARDKKAVTELHTEFLTEAYESKTVTEKQKVKQGKLVIGMRAGMTYDYDNYAAIKVMCAIFGSGTFSKLFMNVREKMSLCYYCSARLINSKGLIVVESDVETENALKALDAIRNELDEVRKGNFTDEVIINAKKSITDTFASVEDSIVTVNGWMTAQSTAGIFRTPDSFIEEINAVSREEIILAASMVTEDTVFILESEKEEE